MRKSLTGFNALLFVIMALAIPSLVEAQATRTWVSGVGDDVNPCSRTAPCKTFAGAISKTAAAGEINCLDPGGFGSVTITKSITIDCKTTTGSILAALVNGIIINIAPTDVFKTVRIRGIVINGASNGINGIRILAANKVFIEDVVIDGFTQNGVDITVTTANAKIFVKNTQIRNAAGSGINLAPVAGASLLVDNSYLEGNTNGLLATNGSQAVIRNSSATGNVTGLSSDKGEISVVSCVVAHNTTGVQTTASTSLIRLSDVSVVNNRTGLSAPRGSITSFKNNIIQGNQTDGAPNSTASLQ